MSVLEVNNIMKSFGRTEVLKNISFSLEKGEVLAIIGSSGSGKTTLLRCINFLETPQGGIISVNNEVLFDAADPLKKREKIAPEFPLAERNTIGAIFSAHSERAPSKPLSALTALMVSDILIPVSPSGTGKTFILFIAVLLLSSAFAADISISAKICPFINI